MTEIIRNVRGMPDVLPEQAVYWRHLEQVAVALLQAYGYAEVRLPLLESTELFTRSIGAVTDIVEKEMYTFADRNGDSLSLRPEGTAGAVRCMIQHGLLLTPGTKIWYQGPMFRHERPQRGRQRQFSQIGVEVFGIPDAGIDAELIIMSHRLWQRLGLAAKIKLKINSLGNRSERQQYRQQLQDWLRQHRQQLDEDSLRRMETNPLRVLDSKNPALQQLLAEAPTLLQQLGSASRAHYDQVCAMLNANDIDFQHDDRLVRGLDYYSHTVFEWQTDELGAQGTVCAGGRYDDLVELHGARPTPGIGFAMGQERLVALLEQQSLAAPAPLLYVVVQDASLRTAAMQLVERCRDALPEAVLLLDHLGGSMKAQMKRANRSGAVLGLIVAAEEQQRGEVSVRHMQSDAQQQTLPADELPDWLAGQYASLQ